ncbi:MAG: hypothetical protein LBV18_03145 [Alistipes sp.]|jgi:bacterioferritin (cytochrome b1)|nr:hypothetical protein [Alistipes sp.]
MKEKSLMFSLMRERGTNLIDELTTALVNNMRFSDHNVLYPTYGVPKPNEGVRPEWFYDAYKASNGYSELDSIHMYITQEAMFEELGEMMMGVALVEMKHLDKLGDLIMSLGGQVARPGSTESIEYGSSPVEAVHFALSAEQSAVKGYDEIMEKVIALPQNETTRYTLTLLAKLMADERLHIEMFEEWLRENANRRRGDE